MARGAGRKAVVVKGYRVWLDRALSLVTAVVLLVAAYFVLAERVVPALRDEPAPVGVGDRLSKPLRFEPLAAGRVSRGGSSPLRVPAGRPALLLVFSSRCPACYANLPAWRRALNEAGGEVLVVGVGLERSRKAAAVYAARHLPGAVAVASSQPRRFAQTLGIELVPFTALVDTAGVVQFARPGSLDSLGESTLMQALGALTGSSTP